MPYLCAAACLSRSTPACNSLSTTAWSSTPPACKHHCQFRSSSLVVEATRRGLPLIGLLRIHIHANIKEEQTSAIHKWHGTRFSYSSVIVRTISLSANINKSSLQKQNFHEGDHCQHVLPSACRACSAAACRSLSKDASLSRCRGLKLVTTSQFLSIQSSNLVKASQSY